MLLVPALTVQSLSLAPRTHRVVLDTAVAQLRENVGLSTLSLASIIVSFSLMVAMAIMVYSFRVSFEHWLGKLLPADLQMREPFGNDTAYWSAADQARLAATAGVARVEFRRTRQLLLDPARAPVTLIARGADRRAGSRGAAAGAKRCRCRCPRTRSLRGFPRRCRISTATDVGESDRRCRLPAATAASPSPASGATTRARPAPS